MGKTTIVQKGRAVYRMEDGGQAAVKVVATDNVKVAAVDDIKVAAVDDINGAAVDDVKVAAVDDVKVAAVDDVKVAAVDDVKVAAVDDIKVATVDDIKVAVVNDIKVAAVDDVKVAAVDDVKVAAVDDVKVAAVDDVKVAAVDDVKVAAVDDVKVAAVDDVKVAAVEDVKVAAVDDVKVAAVDDAKVAAVDDVKVAATDNVKVAAFEDYRAREGMTPDQIVRIFSTVADIYDETWKAKEYKDPEFLSDGVAEFFSGADASSVRILDVGAGTGLVGEQLKKRGFSDIDGLDPSIGMRNQAVKKEVYKTYYLDYMDGHHIDDIAPDTYDCVVAAGCFNRGLLPCAALLEMARVVRPGGLVCFAIFDYNLTAVSEYNNRLGPLMSWMEKEGVWELLDKKQRTDSDITGTMETVYRYTIRVSEVDVPTLPARLPLNGADSNIYHVNGFC